jgi:hypothetical protein
VTRKQIRFWLRATPAEAVDAALVDLVTEGKITAGPQYEIVKEKIDAG